MVDIMGKKWIYFLISGLVIIPGLVSLLLFGLRLSIDFTGGTLLEIQNTKIKSQSEIDDVKKIFVNNQIEVSSVTRSSQDSLIFRTQEFNKDKNEIIKKAISQKYGEVMELRFETVGPTIGNELAQKAFMAVVLASIMIVIYIALSFRSVPKPFSSVKFGVCAVIALLHDVFVLIGVFSLFGHFYKVEIDSLFVTALLTVIGFSVHDTIVVFDRIRENLKRMPGKSFSFVTNESIVQTLGRSLSTTLTVLFTLSALLLFGGETTKWFVVALLIGITSGTYSSIFNAAPLLVIWEEKASK